MFRPKMEVTLLVSSRKESHTFKSAAFAGAAKLVNRMRGQSGLTARLMLNGSVVGRVAYFGSNGPRMTANLLEHYMGGRAGGR